MIDRFKKKEKSQKHFSLADKKDLLQPLSKNGYSNPDFNEVYGEKNNPFTGSDRDINKRKRYF